MRLRSPILLAALAASALLVGAITAAAANQQSDKLTCDEILSLDEAGTAMDPDYPKIAADKKLVTVRESLEGHTVRCQFHGETTATAAPNVHDLIVKWGPYGDFRASRAASKAAICKFDKNVCRFAEDALAAKSDTRSFALWAVVYGHLGVVTRPSPTSFQRNPAFFWETKPELVGGLHVTYGYVYVVKLRALLSVFCVHAESPEYDTACAVSALKRAYNNVTP